MSGSFLLRFVKEDREEIKRKENFEERREWIMENFFFLKKSKILIINVIGDDYWYLVKAT